MPLVHPSGHPGHFFNMAGYSGVLLHGKTVVIAVYLLQICLSDWSCNEVLCHDQMDCIVPRLLSIAMIVLVHLHVHCNISTHNPGPLGSSHHGFIALLALCALCMVRFYLTLLRA